MKQQTSLLIIKKSKGIIQPNGCACQIWLNVFNVVAMFSATKK